MRRVTAEEAGTFDKLARERVAELQDALRSQTELLDDFTRMHESSSAQLDEVRTFTNETMERLSKLDREVKRQLQANEESTAAAAEKLKHASATEMNSIQQRAMAIDEFARKHIAEVERAAERLLAAETSTAEGLREFERQMESRRAEIERVLEDRVATLRQQVQEADAAVVRRMTDLGQRAEGNAQALETRLARAAEERTEELDTRLDQAADERAKDLEAYAKKIVQTLDARLARATQEISAASANDGRMKKLVEMLAAAQVGLDQIADRVETLEGIAVAADPPEERYNGGEERYEEVDAGPPENGASQAPRGDGDRRRVPTRNAQSTPDLRWDQ
jgi:DNA repair exonuclease SbcCD ATPase subunit